MANSLHVRKGDRVKVIAGNDKGKIGEIISVDPKARKVVVEGVNLVKKHTKSVQQGGGSNTGGIITVEAPIHVSNVMVVDSDGKPTRIGYRRDEETGKNVRIAKSNGKDL